MMSMIAIEIDFDVYKAIEAERRSFDEPRNSALRRLIRLPEARDTPPTPAPVPQGWRGGGVNLPASSQVRMSYSGRTHEGSIEKGAWVVEGRRYKSPSGAASGVARTKEGNPTKLDGWIYWEVLLPGSGEWVRLGELRRQARRRSGEGSDGLLDF